MLSGKQKSFLRGLGHHLEPVVLVGKEGHSEGVTGAVKQALLEHELVKVRLSENVPEDRHAIALSVASATVAELVQVLGRTFLVYRRREEDPKIALPR